MHAARNTLRSLLPALPLVALLAGCGHAMNPIGEATFDCNRKQDARSPYCRSFKAVEASTAGEVPPSRFDKAFTLSDLDRLTGISPDQTPPAGSATGTSQPSSSAAGSDQSALRPGPGLLAHQVHEAAPLQGMPLRVGPVVQRVWIKRFVDGRDVLTENTVVYREIKGTRWAGFDGMPPGTLVPSTSYPHRAATDPEAGARLPKPPADTRPAPEFKQPGASTELPESATVPAASGTSTMPQ